MSKSVGLFLGKFQPPHLGHIRTILNIKNKYSRLIIGITEDERILKPKEIQNILIDVFKDFENIEVVIIHGIVEQGTAKLPNDIDVVLSGNHKVLDKLSSRYKTEFVARTEGIGYSATEIRESMLGSKMLSLKNPNINLKMELVKIATLKPLELILPSHLRNIEEMIERDKIVKKPLIVDRKNMIVLDGSHRYAYLYGEGYEYAPVILVDYDDEAIFVGKHLKHRFIKDENFTISKAEVRQRAIHENLYPPRTTRHFFPFRKEDFPIALLELRKGEKRDISHLLENISLLDEMALDRGYINEIDEEIVVIQEYLKEQYETQIKMMESNVAK
ncbi:Y4yB [hydrothermal vent metagenome]|uniref:Y4yB n=1 Tax=hydrothermal vent metagenome TaxID=652676 RepID=A0A1W1CY82_9ZZZZ